MSCCQCHTFECIGWCSNIFNCNIISIDTLLLLRKHAHFLKRINDSNDTLIEKNCLENSYYISSSIYLVFKNTIYCYLYNNIFRSTLATSLHAITLHKAISHFFAKIIFQNFIVQDYKSTNLFRYAFACMSYTKNSVGTIKQSRYYYLQCSKSKSSHVKFNFGKFNIHKDV